jgi:hypothetical protein
MRLGGEGIFRVNVSYRAVASCARAISERQVVTQGYSGSRVPHQTKSI